MLSYNEGLEIIMKKVKEYLGENFTERSSVDDAITLNCKDFNIDVHINIIGRDYEILDVCEEMEKVVLKSDALKGIPDAEEKLKQAKRVRDSIPLVKNSAERIKAEEGVQAATRKLMELKKQAGFSVKV